MTTATLENEFTIVHDDVETDITETSSDVSEVEQEPTLRNETAAAAYSEEERGSLQRDDAMASGMIAVILGLAFFVLIAVVTGATLWTVANV